LTSLVRMHFSFDTGNINYDVCEFFLNLPAKIV
jgi:hypothetical protein